MKIITLIFLTVVLAACSDNNPLNDGSGTVRFIAIGDTGTGEAGQYTVADAVERVCLDRGCDFALGLGDNIYESGVTSVEDAQFVDKFEEPYKSLNFPFYMALGNHDNATPGLLSGLGLVNESGEYQVDYTYRATKQSYKWKMPARYYAFDMPKDVSSPVASFFALDSNPLASFPDANERYAPLQYLAKHQSWLNGEMNSSKGKWKIAFAHHPYVSNGGHGNAGFYDGIPFYGLQYKMLIDNAICGKADLLITGHDHDLQVLEPTESCDTDFIISGAGAKTRPLNNETLNQASFQQGDTLGFFYIEATKTALTMTAYTVDEISGVSTEVFQKTLTK